MTENWSNTPRQYLQPSREFRYEILVTGNKTPTFGIRAVFLAQGQVTQQVAAWNDPLMAFTGIFEEGSQFNNDILQNPWASKTVTDGPKVRIAEGTIGTKVSLTADTEKKIRQVRLGGNYIEWAVRSFEQSFSAVLSFKVVEE